MSWETESDRTAPHRAGGRGAERSIMIIFTVCVFHLVIGKESSGKPRRKRVGCVELKEYTRESIASI